MIPIVLHHGIFNLFTFQLGRLKVSAFSGGIEETIAGRGHPLIISKVHPTAGIATRAQQLKAKILADLQEMGRPDGSVIVIAHSMGGLDARYMISRLGMDKHVSALVTISTPHRGSPYATFCKHHLCDRLGAFELARWLGLDINAVNDLTPEACRRFNETTPDVPGVGYYSISGARPDQRVPAFAYHAWKVIHEAEGDNDGLVSLSSSVWGKSLGTWPLHHWHQVNKRLLIERNGIGNISHYYLRMLDEIEADGVEMGGRMNLCERSSA
ncbi:MAG TPA: hypothetical protein VFE47_26175 [Tepidisphaeraceae bacterium]|jgi:triacylglycerol lipase|nr:hypothetical protein [Tepidisphaeraceae bacterium]